ncbi:hypothetical protein K7G95_14745 [Escherichia coli]|nr:hypothetical protein K7G95_14745 [Escherichia coli]
MPQHSSNDKALSELWDEYRQRMIGLSGIAIFLLGINSMMVESLMLMGSEGVSNCSGNRGCRASTWRHWLYGQGTS